MPELNVRHRQPVAAFWYTTLGAMIACAFIFYFGFAVVTSNALDNTITPDMAALLLGVILLGSFLVIAYPILNYLFFTYEVGEHAITIHSGIIFRQHETINFSRIQVIDNERNPVMMLFGITLMEIWTASPDQLQSAPSARPSPDTRMYLYREEAEALKRFILDRPSVGAPL